MPNLTILTLQTGKHDMHGHQWKQFIIDYLPKLKIFRFLMLFHVNNEDEINEIIDSYRTPFWLIDHQWSIRCHWALENNQIWTYIYTLPYTFFFYSYVLKSSNVHIKSTCPNENGYCSYNCIITLKQSQLMSLNGLFISNIYFDNIQHLEVSFPFPDQFLSVIPRLDQLISLNISSNSDIDANIFLSQLQILIDRAPRLYFLTIAHWDSSIIQDLLLHINSKSIRRLDFQSYHYLKRDRCFNNEQCAAFIRSPLAKQCEVLQIVIDNRSNIDYLINEMDNLEALKVVFQSGQCNDYIPTMEEHITWMSSGYSRTFTENLRGTETIRLWIR
jgi:hypothetical protein